MERQVILYAATITGPAAEPVTLPEAKLAARIDDSEFDLLIPGLIAAARKQAEHETGLRFVQQTVRVELSDWPAADDVLPVANPSAVVVSYWAGSAWVAASGFVFGAQDAGTVIAPNVGTNWPTLGQSALAARVRVDITTGEADPADVDEGIKTYIKAVVAAWLKSPEGVTDKPLTASPMFDCLLDNFLYRGSTA